MLFSWLQLADLFKYAGDFSANHTVALPHLTSPWGLLVLGCTLLASICWLAACPPRLCPHAAPACGCTWWPCPACGACVWPQQTQYVHQNEHQDYLSSNLPSGTDIPFLPPCKHACVQRPPQLPLQVASQRQARPVIVLVVESLSVHHSQNLPD